jgi:ABC-type uncharacterized transport system auxiliary subunit
MRANSLAEQELTLIHSSNHRVRAEAVFRKVLKVQDREKAAMEYEAETQAGHEKTARLRALRLAKEAANLEP